MKVYLKWLVLVAMFGGIAYVALQTLTVSVPDADARDRAHAFETTQLQKRLNAFHEINGKYPSTLKEIIETTRKYRYSTTDSGQTYRLCADLETRPDVCVGSPR